MSSQLDVAAVSEELIKAYKTGAEGLSPEAAQYMALLSAAELLALAVESGTVDKPIADDFLRTLCIAGTFNSKVIEAMRSSWGNQRIYRCLGNKLREFTPARREVW